MAANNNITRTRARLAFRNFCKLVFEFLPTACVLLITYLMLRFWLGGVEMFPHQPHSLAFRSLSMFLSLCWYCFLLAASYSMGFCKLHRQQISYLYLAALSIWIHRWWGFGSLAEPLAGLGFALGAYLICVVLYRLIIRRIIYKIRKRAKRK